MSDQADLEKQIIASDKRFEIYVPKPKSRINLGATARKADPDGPWAHPGVTIATEENVVVSAAKDMVLQSAGNTNFLVGGSLGHYTKADVNLTAGADMRVSAAKRVLIMSGANNDPGAQALTGDSLRLQAYNQLAQHYRIDAHNVGLYEFFHGRRERPLKDPTAMAKAFAKKGTTPRKRLAKFNHEKTVAQLAKAPELEGGFAENTLRTLDLLYPAEREAGDAGDLFYPRTKAFYPKSRSKAQTAITIPPRFAPPAGKTIPARKAIKDPSDPRYWIEDLFADDPVEAGTKKAPPSTIFGTEEIDALKHGFSRYFDRFDPYHLVTVKAYAKPAQRALAMMRNTMTRARRALDCLLYVSAAPGMLTQLLVDAIGSLPVVGQALGALKGAMAAYDVVADRVDYYSKVKDPSEVPAAANILAFAEPFEAKAPERKASVVTAEGPWDLSTGGPWKFEVTCQSSKVVDVTLDLGEVAARPAVLTFTAGELDVLEDADGNAIGLETAELRLEIDGREHSFTLTMTNAAAPADAARVIQAAVASLATVSEADGVITITTLSVGPASRVQILDYDDNAEKEDLYGAVPGAIAYGTGIVPPVADPTKVTAEEIAARLLPASPAEITAEGKALRITSDKEGNGSRIAASGSLADKLFAQPDGKPPLKSEEHLVAKSSPDWAEIDSAGSITAPLKKWVEYVNGLPDAVGSVFTPLTDAASDLLAVMEGLQAAAEALAGADLLLPGPPESVGIFGSQGITLGTHDRIVASGSHGMLFVVDGGSGEPDKAKQLGKLEFVAKFTGGFAPPLRASKKKKQSLGFRVYSDSVIDLDAGQGVQLLAMGRGSATSKRPDGKLTGGVGVARVLGSFATEVAGYEKVVISARSAGDPADTDAKTGGRVELAGQTIAIGGVRIDDKDPAGDPYGPFDFDHPDGVGAHPNIGISPIAGLETVALSEHLHLHAPKPAVAQTTPGWDDAPSYLKGMSKWAWPEQLRKEHPPTQRVHVHSSKEAVIVVGPYMIQVTKDAGVSVGYRKASKDPAKNDLDTKQPHWVLEETGVRFVKPNDGKSDHTTLGLEEGKATLSGTDGSGSAGALELEEGSAKLSAGDADSLEVSKSSGVKIAASKIDLTGSGPIKIKSDGQIEIG